MTTDKKIARRKLSLLELAADLGNVSKACRVMGFTVAFATAIATVMVGSF